MAAAWGFLAGVTLMAAGQAIREAVQRRHWDDLRAVQLRRRALRRWGDR